MFTVTPPEILSTPTENDRQYSRVTRSSSKRPADDIALLYSQSKPHKHPSPPPNSTPIQKGNPTPDLKRPTYTK